jgi:hypothetical protein
MIKITLTLSVISTYLLFIRAIMEILDEFDIKIIKELRKMVEWLIPHCNQLKKYRIPWCINASIDYSNKAFIAGINQL